jgi:hypothetical protein
MNGNSNGYNGPKLHVVVKSSEIPGKYRWWVTMMTQDATSARQLGYRASGRLDELDGVIFETGCEVHDEGRDVWTTMNATDRPDIRKQIRSLVQKANEKMKDSGEDSFERLIS